MNARRLALLAATSSLLVCCRWGYEELPSGVLSGSGSSASGAGGNAGTDAVGGDATGGSGTTAGSSNGGTAPSVGGAPDGGADGSLGGSPDSGTGGGAGSGGSAGTGASAGSAGMSGSAGSGGGSGNGGCTAATYGGHNYWICTTPKTYLDAALDCAGRGYYPVRIDSAGEQSFVHDTIPIADQDNNNISLWRWLGATSPGLAGDWQWGDGQQFWTGGKNGMAVGGAYTSWSQGQPGNQACLAMQARSGLWTSMGCLDARPYVCEQY